MHAASSATGGLATDVRMIGAQLHLLPIETRVPLKFGGETLTSVTCARACVRVADRAGRTAVGWGETPLSVQWVWPSATPYAERLAALEAFTSRLAGEWVGYGEWGHPVELGVRFQRDVLEHAAEQAPRLDGGGRIPQLAALVCCSPYDLALYDAYGKLLGRPTMECLGSDFLSADLQELLEGDAAFAGKRPADYLRPKREETLPAWHLVGGLDPLDESELTGTEPDDGYPVLLRDWIRRDGLRCLKIKLRGDDADWDYDRLARIGAIAQAEGVDALTADFNCTVTDPGYVVEVLEKLERDAPETHGSLTYVEQPFPYDLEANPIDVREVSKRKPLLLDESAHDWRFVRRGRELGWTGVALKTCKTLSGALLSQAWAKQHGMALMVQDLTNPMLAQAPHVLLAAWVETLRGVETNGMQFYPEASAPEAAIHPGLYARRDGVVRLETLRGPGFGYAGAESVRDLPPPVASAGEIEEGGA
ncbi:MAG: mandelate racemase/muconate lactonizing enzyme family protein [Planctomycetota bacterium]